VQAVSGRPGRVVSLDCKRLSDRCPLLYDLTSLQRDANKRHGFSAERTLQAAQALYEQRKALTYPRTDSRYLSADMKPQLKRVARSLGDFSEYAVAVAVVVALAKIPARIVDDKKVTDHHAIIPTPAPHDRGGWSNDERKVFDLVARRFLAVFHPAAKIENTTVLTDVDGTDGTSYRFRSRGRIIAEPGWRAVYDTVPEADERASGRKTQDEEDEKDEGELPTELAVKAALACSGAEAEERKTKPPSAYTEATLLSAMETAGRLVDEEELREAMKDGGLGTPATRANIIETLLKREYIARQGKRLRATSKGTATIELLGENHPLASPELTGSWEARLHRVARGEEDRAAFMADITRLTGELTSGIATLTSQTLGAPPVANVCPCPRCGESIRETAKTFMCSSWKSEDDAGCGFRIWKVVAKRRLTPDEARQLIETGHSEVLEGFVSKKGAAFAAALELKDDPDDELRVRAPLLDRRTDGRPHRRGEPSERPCGSSTRVIAALKKPTRWRLRSCAAGSRASVSSRSMPTVGSPTRQPCRPSPSRFQQKATPGYRWSPCSASPSTSPRWPVCRRPRVVDGCGSVSTGELCDALSGEAGESSKETVGGSCFVGGSERCAEFASGSFEFGLGGADGFEGVGDVAEFGGELRHRFSLASHLSGVRAGGAISFVTLFY
jgi:DNA topoisomerase III